MPDQHSRLVNKNPHKGRCPYRLSQRDPVVFWGMWIVTLMVAFSLGRSILVYDFKSITLYLVIVIAILFTWFLEACLTSMVCLYSDTYHKLVAAQRLLSIYRHHIERLPAPAPSMEVLKEPGKMN